MAYRLFFFCAFGLLGWWYLSVGFGVKLPAEYKKAILTPGIGLEDIKIGKTPLESFLEGKMKGSLGVTASDPGYAYEVRFDKGDFIFFFKIPKACIDVVRDARTLLSIQNESEEFFRDYPTCKNIVLSSIFVGPKFLGKTSGGVGIGEKIFDTANRFGEVDTKRNHDFTARPDSSIPASENWKESEFLEGIRVYTQKIDSSEVIQGFTIYNPKDIDFPESLENTGATQSH